MLAGERKTMASAPFLELLGLRNRAGWGGGVDDDHKEAGKTGEICFTILILL